MRRNSFAALALLAAIYLLTGTVGHDPWRGADAAHLGPVLEMLDGRSLLFPSIGGTVLPDFGPLYYWLGALLAGSLGSLIPVHDAVRLSAALFSALTLLGLWRASQSFGSEESAPGSVLLTLGCLGLVIHAHENQPMLALMAAQAWTLAGALGISREKRGAGLVCGLGVGAAILAGGIDGALLCLPLSLGALLARSTNARPRNVQVMSSLAVATLIAAAWLIPLALLAPAAMRSWLAIELASFSPPNHEASALRDWVKLLAWFVWPLWPLALWQLWWARKRMSEPALAIPLLALVLGMLHLLTFGSPSPARVMPLIVPLALLAAQAIPSLRRGGAAAFDWFAVMTFSFFGLLLICSWSAMIFDWPPGLARHFRKLAPAFELVPSVPALVVGSLVCLVWIAYLLLRRPAGRDAPLTWAVGMTAMWCLAVSLLQPWFDYGKSYRNAGETIALALRDEDRDCVASLGLGPSQRSSMLYFAGLRTRVTRDGHTDCKVLLTYGQSAASVGALEHAGWKEVWEYRRGGSRQFEIFRMYRRS